MPPPPRGRFAGGSRSWKRRDGRGGGGGEGEGGQPAGPRSSCSGCTMGAGRAEGRRSLEGLGAVGVSEERFASCRCALLAVSGCSEPGSRVSEGRTAASGGEVAPGYSSSIAFSRRNSFWSIAQLKAASSSLCAQAYFGLKENGIVVFLMWCFLLAAAVTMPCAQGVVAGGLSPDFDFGSECQVRSV